MLNKISILSSTGSRDMKFIMVSYLKVQFREKSLQSLLIQTKILRNFNVFNFSLKFMELTMAKGLNEDYYLQAEFNDVLHICDA